MNLNPNSKELKRDKDSNLQDRDLNPSCGKVKNNQEYIEDPNLRKNDSNLKAKKGVITFSFFL